METKFIIHRFDPKKDEKPYSKEYKLDTAGIYTILDALIYIREYKDRSLAFRHSCRASICGSCAVRVNDRAVLACKTQIKDEVKKFGMIKVEPLKGLKVVKDLVCDLNPFFDQIRKVHPWLEPKTEVPSCGRERKMAPYDVQKIYKSVSCIFCACCYTDCPVSNNTDNYLGPAAATKAYRFVKDSRDIATKERLKDLEKLGIWYCAHAGNCVSRCPKEIEPIELIAELREISIKEGIKKNDGARHVLAFSKSIKKIGELDEVRLPLRTFGIFRVIKFLPIGIRLMLRGKMPPIWPKKIKKLEQVKKIYKDINL